jgi:predicted DNA-binding protein
MGTNRTSGTEQLGGTLPPDLVERLAALADSRGRTLREEIEDALSTYLADEPPGQLAEDAPEPGRPVRRSYAIEPELVQALRRRIRRTLRPLSDELRFAIELHLAKAEEKAKPKKEKK